MLEEFEKLHGVIARTLKPLVDKATNTNQRSDNLKKEAMDPEDRILEAKKSQRRGSTTTVTSRVRVATKESRRNSAPSKPLSRPSTNILTRLQTFSMVPQS